MPFLMVRNDITKVRADAIVNPANEELLEGSGTSRAIYLAAGESDLDAACRKVGGCAAGGAVLTPAFRLPAKYVIHAVGPVWAGGDCQESEFLYHTYMSALALADEYDLESVAFPLLSSGNYGFPKEEALRVAVRAISDFLMEHEMLVYLVLYDRSAVSLSKKLTATLDEYIDDHYVEEKDEGLPADERYSEIMRRRRAADLSAPMRSQMPQGQSIPKTQTKERKPFSAKLKKPHRLSEQAIEASPLAAARSLDDLIDHMDETFSQMLLRLIDERQLKDSYVYKKANIDRRNFSKIRNDVNYAPSKKTALAFAFVLELSLDETKDLLLRAGYAFSNSSRFDVIICFFIENEDYNIFEINEVLFSYGEAILG